LTDLPAGIIVDEHYEPYTIISNLEYEMQINEAKRKIKLLHPDHLYRVLTEFKRITESKFQRARS